MHNYAGNWSGALLAIVLACAGCAPPLTIDEGNSRNAATGFANGDIVLADSMATIPSYQKHKLEMHNLYLKGDWQSLSRLVIEVNYDNELDWFYLGRSAEGLGLNDAARHYYGRALSTVHKCVGVFIGDECDGLSFPRDVMIRVNAMDASRK
jgi:hypothetical protein